jgi:hypothetical protein
VSNPQGSDAEPSQTRTFVNEKVNVLLVTRVDSSAILTSDELAAAHYIPVVIMGVRSTSGHIYAVVRANRLTVGADAAKYS